MYVSVYVCILLFMHANKLLNTKGEFPPYMVVHVARSWKIFGWCKADTIKYSYGVQFMYIDKRGPYIF